MAQPELLVLDDDAEVLNLIPDEVKEQFSLKYFPTAESFYAYILSEKFVPENSIGLFDVDLGGSDEAEGLTIVEELVNDFIFFPVIFVSESNRRAVRIRAAHIGSYDYIQKHMLKDGDYGAAHLRAAVTRARGTLDYSQSFKIPEVNEWGKRAVVLASSLEHEVAGVVQPIMNYCAQLMSPNPQQDIKATVSAISEGLTALSEMIGSTFDILKTGKATEFAPSINVLEVVTWVVKAFDEQHPGQIVFVCDCEPYVRIHKSRLRQISENLLSNAFKYGLPRAKIYVSLKINNDHVTLTVLSEGRSVKGKRDSARMFLPHFRMADDIESASGQGLGLAVVKLITEMYGGRAYHEASVYDESSEGNLFGVSLPIIT